MGGVKAEILIVDANVLIDFCTTNPSILALVCTHVAVVNVAEPVLDEVEQLDRVTAEALGIRVVTPDFPCLSRAATLAQRSPLQFQDWVCLLLAETNHWTCVTNDKRLRTECQTRHIAIMWGLELLVRLVEEGVLPEMAAIELAEEIHLVNKRLPRTVIAAFIRRVRGTRS